MESIKEWLAQLINDANSTIEMLSKENNKKGLSKKKTRIILDKLK